MAEEGTTAALNLVGNDTDIDGDTLSVQSIAGTTLTPGTAQSIAVTNGTVNVDTAGVITFSPATNYNGTISFDYVVTDGVLTDTATVSVRLRLLTMGRLRLMTALPLRWRKRAPPPR